MLPNLTVNSFPIKNIKHTNSWFYLQKYTLDLELSILHSRDISLAEFIGGSVWKMNIALNIGQSFLYSLIILFRAQVSCRKNLGHMSQVKESKNLFEWNQNKMDISLIL